jgi:hypothetical protein
VLYLPDGTPSCQGTLSISPSTAVGSGTQTVTVQNQSGQTLCSAQLTVTDSSAPTLTQHTVDLWPPNHKWHEVAVSDCVSAIDSCDGDLQGEFIYASSDEPIDSIGDGHFAPDIGLGRDAQHACVRSERQGPKDGRVYKLGVRVTDKAGNSVESECLVIVDHDQRGVTGKDSGESYRITFDPSQPGLDCGSGPPAGGGGSGGGNAGAGSGNGGSGGGNGGASGGNGGSGGGVGGTGSGGTGSGGTGSGGTGEGSGGTGSGNGGTGSGGTSEGSGGTGGTGEPNNGAGGTGGQHVI